VKNNPKKLKKIMNKIYFPILINLIFLFNKLNKIKFIKKDKNQNLPLNEVNFL
jgi:hypothetical protein